MVAVVVISTESYIEGARGVAALRVGAGVARGRDV